MKFLSLMAPVMLLACAAPLERTNKSYEARVIFNSLHTVSSRDQVPFDLVWLKNSFPSEKILTDEERLRFLKVLEDLKLGKSSFYERKQMQSPVFIAVFYPSENDKPVYVSDGCHLLDMKSGDLYEINAFIAVSLFGISAEDYEHRLCKEPGFGIKAKLGS